MKLYVMRHGPAEDSSKSGRDFDRKLTPSGVERTRRVAASLGEHGESPRRIIASPLVRAQETARAVVDELGLDLDIETSRDLAPGGPAHGLVDTLVGEGARRVMLVGHEPDVSHLVARLLGGFHAGFDKAMVVGIRVRQGERPEHRFTLDPKSLVWQRD